MSKIEKKEKGNKKYVLADNAWEEEVQIIKRAELELIGTSDPAVIHFSGAPKGLAVMELEEDLGVMIRHNYTVHNKGPWTVRNVVAKVTLLNATQDLDI